MAAGTPYLAGKNTPGTAATQTAAITTATGPADAVSVHIGASAATDTITSVTDSEGNAYTLVDDSPGATAFSWHYLATGATALRTTDTVTVVFTGSSATKSVIVTGCSGITTASAAAATDAAVNTHGSSASPSAATGALGSAPEMSLATFSYASGGAPLTLASGWTPVTTNGDLTVGWLLTPSRAAVTASGTLNASAQWSALQVTLIPQVYSPPAIPAFPAGYGPLASDMDTWVQATLGFYAQGILFRGIQAVSESLTSGSFKTLSWDTVLEDPTGSYSATATGSQSANSFLAPWTGWYEITFGWSYGPAGLTDSQSALLIDGTTSYHLGQIGLAQACGLGSFIIPLVGTVDYVEMQAFVSSSGLSTTVSAAGLQPACEISFVST